MNNQLTTNAEALRLFFTEEVYLVKETENSDSQTQNSPVEQAKAFIASEEVLLHAPQMNVEPPRDWKFEYLGKNQKGILILVNDSQNKVSTPRGTELLRKLVKAIELSNNDFALLNYAQYLEAKFEHLLSFFNCKVLLAFGIDSRILGLNDLELHQMHSFGPTKMIFTKNLHDLDGDKASKKMLWDTLQNLR